MNPVRRIGGIAKGLWSRFIWGQSEIRTELPSGVRLSIGSRSEWDVFVEVFVAGEYDEAIRLAFMNAAPNRPVRILDLGANVGYFSLRCMELSRQMSPRPVVEIVAVEGVARVFEIMRGRCGENRFDNVHVSAYNGLIGRRQGSAHIYDVDYACANTVVPQGGKKSHLRFRGAHAVSAEYLDLDRVVPGDTGVDLIKCDIEGSELTFLETYPDLLQRTRYLAIEIHPQHCSLEACQGTLARLGFKSRRTVRELPTAIHYLMEKAADGSPSSAVDSHPR